MARSGDAQQASKARRALNWLNNIARTEAKQYQQELGPQPSAQADQSIN